MGNVTGEIRLTRAETHAVEQALQVYAATAKELEATKKELEAAKAELAEAKKPIVKGSSPE